MVREEHYAEAQHLLQYEQWCHNLLTQYALCHSGALEIARIVKGKLEQRPKELLRMLDADEIPPFNFILSKN
ncbi:MAG: hypothetical protein QM731_16820 [Chitinophagaceae bacterium]